MTRSENIASRAKEVLLNGHWIANTNMKTQVQSVTWNEAIQKVDSLNTIAALTFHINYYLSGLVNVFEGGKLEIHDKFSFDAPPIQSEEDWKKLVDDFLSNATKFIEHIEKMNDSKLDEPFVDVNYGTYQRNIEGIIEHTYYHLGQISLIKKMVLTRFNK